MKENKQKTNEQFLELGGKRILNSQCTDQYLTAIKH